MIRCHNHQYFIEKPFLGRLSTKTEELHLPMIHGYSPLDANPIFICHGAIIVVFITGQLLLLSLLLYLLFLSEKGFPLVIFTETTSMAKWLSVRLRTRWLWVRVTLQSLKAK